MALIKCTECGKEVSDKAAACPNCGAPIDAGTTPKVHSVQGGEVKPVKEKKKGSCLKTILIVVIAFFLFILFIGFLAGDDETTTSNNEPQKTEEADNATPETEKIEDATPKSETEKTDHVDNKSESKEVSNAFHVGDIVETSDSKITFISAKIYQSDNEFIVPEDGNVFYRFEFEFENTGSSDLAISSLISWNCYADGYAMNQSWVGDDVLDATISPGRKAKGAIYYEIPKDAKSIDVEYETNFWLENKIIFVVK